IVEGMACGRAVIASKAGGAAELIHTNGQALLKNIETEIDALSHEPGNAEVLAERITQLARDPQLRARLGAAGRASVEQRFNRARLAGEIVPIYRSASAAAN